MEPPIFYAPPEKFTDDTVELPREEAHHALNVLRLKPASIVMIVDGLGNACKGEILAGSKDTVRVRVHSRRRDFGEPAVRLTLAAGLSTSSKFDETVAKGTELGVKRFVPIITEKSKVKIDDPARARGKVTRLEKVALAAMKQCRRSYRPEISVPQKLPEFLREIDAESLNLIFALSKHSIPFDQIKIDHGVKRVCLLVGPEAGFSEEEIAQAVSAGFVQVSLGSRILRTETAGPVTCALVMLQLGELS
jgi:16S rRNA (uracil1498-N3)-methyltransferase